MMNYELLTHTALFRGYFADQIEEVLLFLHCRLKSYEKHEPIYLTGDKVTDLGIVMSGSIQIESTDIMGNRSILGISEAGDVFAESYACIPGQPIMVDVVAREHSEILFLNLPTLLVHGTTDDRASRLIINLLMIASAKNQKLSMRIFHSSPKTIRARLFSYFSEQVKLQDSMHVRIPLDRQQLADYLGVDRTALSKELGKMKKEGLIDFRKNDFVLHFDE